MRFFNAYSKKVDHLEAQFNFKTRTLRNYLAEPSENNRQEVRWRYGLKKNPLSYERYD